MNTATPNNPTPELATPTQTSPILARWWNSEAAHTWLVDRPISVGLVLIIAFIAHWVLRRLINRIAHQAIKNGSRRMPLPSFTTRGSRSRAHNTNARAQVAALDQTHEDRRVSRIKTLSGVSRSAAGVFVWVWAGATILSQIGVDVTPLIASAGIIGIALGFGAQSLVKDFLSGIFMLIEDQYGIGDTIDLGNGILGEVESITLRITTIRDIDGALWYVRNGEILQVANHSDNFATARIDVPLSLSNDVPTTRKVIAASVATALESEEVAEMILDEPNVQGITAIEADRVNFRVTIKTLPGSQWAVQRALHAQIWQDLQAHGIETPYPNGIGISENDNKQP